MKDLEIAFKHLSDVWDWIEKHLTKEELEQSPRGSIIKRLDQIVQKKENEIRRRYAK
jgi:hypothetical protein